MVKEHTVRRLDDLKRKKLKGEKNNGEIKRFNIR